MSSTESQLTIAEWARETFGATPTANVASRMNIEMAELLDIIIRVNAQIYSGASAEVVEETMRKAREECADVAIMLFQICHQVDGDLLTEVDLKMGVNRRRTWANDGLGRVQHEEDASGLYFIDHESGLRCRRDRWYVMSDAGSCYTAEGFDAAEKAMEWAMENVPGRHSTRHSRIEIPVWQSDPSAGRYWFSSGRPAQILFGEHLYQYNLHEFPEGSDGHDD